MIVTLVDVFCEAGFDGNPLAAVTGGDELSDAAMLAMTRWFNLSETVFILPATDAGADYRARIFTLDRELPFAGHPTLGAAHVVARARGLAKGALVQQCGAGLVPVRVAGERLSFRAPPLLRFEVPTEAELDAALAVLGIGREAVVEASWIDNGPGWLGILMDSAAAVLAVEPMRQPGRRVEIGLAGPHPPGGPADWEVRALFTDATQSLIEDPVTGSLNAGIGQWLFASGRVQHGFWAAQGTRLGRRGRVSVAQEGDDVWVGGRCMTMVEGGHA